MKQKDPEIWRSRSRHSHTEKMRSSSWQNHRSTFLPQLPSPWVGAAHGQRWNSVLHTQKRRVLSSSVSLGEGPEHPEMQEKLPSQCLSSLIPTCQSPQPPTEACRVLAGGTKEGNGGWRERLLPPYASPPQPFPCSTQT